MTNRNHLKPMAIRVVRANQFSFDDNKLKVSGYVNETGKPSDPIPNWGETDEIPQDESFVEVMKPGVFRDAIQNADFVDFYFEHNPDRYLSSTREGTLNLTEDNTGLKMSANIVPTSWGQDAYTLIKSGAVKSMSFGFVPLQAQWDLSGDTPVRTVTKLQLLEVSAVRFPAYPDSSIEARRKHLQRLNQILEKRGFTLANIHVKRGVKNMPKKVEKKETRSNGAASQGMGAADVQSIVSALGKNSTSVDNLTNAVQEGSEVLSNIAAQIMQSANGDRSKKDVHKASGAAKAQKRSSAVSESAKPASSASSVASSESSVAPSSVAESGSAKPSSVQSEAKPSEAPKSEDGKRTKKASEDPKQAERAAKAVKVMKALKGLNETV